MGQTHTMLKTSYSHLATMPDKVIAVVGHLVATRGIPGRGVGGRGRFVWRQRRCCCRLWGLNWGVVVHAVDADLQEILVIFTVLSKKLIFCFELDVLLSGKVAKINNSRKLSFENEFCSIKFKSCMNCTFQKSI